MHSLILISILIAPKAELKEISGTVIKITDGDTITVLDSNKKQYKIRMNGIDAPERRQAYGTKSKDALGKFIFKKEVLIKWDHRDKYKRIIGDVYLKNEYINLKMVEDGWAWHFKRYSKSQKMAKAEKEARKKKKGLWADSKEQIPPWDFRKKKDNDSEPAKEVFVTKSGTKYHRESCEHLSNSKIKISLKKAKEEYEPCKTCMP